MWLTQPGRRHRPRPIARIGEQAFHRCHAFLRPRLFSRADADAALAEGDFGTYGDKVSAARALVRRAFELASAP